MIPEFLEIETLSKILLLFLQLCYSSSRPVKQKSDISEVRMDKETGFNVVGSQAIKFLKVFA